MVITPYPAVSLKQVCLSIPATAQIHLENLKVYPQILPMLIGEIDIDHIVINAPDFSVALHHKPLKGQEEGVRFDLVAFLEMRFSKNTPVSWSNILS